MAVASAAQDEACSPRQPPRQPPFKGCWRSVKRFERRNAARRSLTMRRLKKHDAHMVNDLLNLVDDSCEDVAPKSDRGSNDPWAEWSSLPVETIKSNPKHLAIGCREIISIPVDDTISPEECQHSRLQIQAPPPRSAPSRLGGEVSDGSRKQPLHRQVARYRPSSECGASRHSQLSSLLAPPSSPRGRIDAPAVRVATRAYEALNGKQPFLKSAKQRNPEIRETSANEQEKEPYWSHGGWWAKTKKIPKWDFCRITGPWANRMKASSLQNYRQWGPDGPLWALQGAK